MLLAAWRFMLLARVLPPIAFGHKASGSLRFTPGESCGALVSSQWHMFPIKLGRHALSRMTLVPRGGCVRAGDAAVPGGGCIRVDVEGRA